MMLFANEMSWPAAAVAITTLLVGGGMLAWVIYLTFRIIRGK